MTGLHLTPFGREVFAIHLSRPEPEPEADEYDDAGSTTTMPVGFAPSAGDQRWDEFDVPSYTGWDE